MMKYRGGQTVTRGTYWCPTSGEVVTVTGKGGKLPGDEKRRFGKAPAPLLVMAMPLMGLVYVIFLPFAGFAALIGYAGYRGWGALQGARAGMWRVATLEWRPGASYLGRRARRTKGGDGEAERLLHEVEEEIARRRGEGKEGKEGKD